MSSKGWKKHTLGDIIDIKHGYAFKGEFFSDEPSRYILVTPGNFRIGGGFKLGKIKYYIGDVPDEYILKEDDVIVTMTDLSKEGDTLGYSALVPDYCSNKFLHNQRLGLLQFKRHDFDRHFIYWLLRTKAYQTFIVNSASGSTVKHTSPSRIREFEFIAPEVQTQRRIADILSVLDDKIELNRQTNATLEAIAQAIFKEWFVDFNFPGATGELVESELGMIPKGWWVGKLEEIITNFDRKRVPLSSRERENRKGIFPYYGAASILDYIDDYLFDGVYLLMGEDGTVITEDEKPILQYVSGKFWVNNHTHVLRGKGIFSTEYIFLVLKNTSVKHIVTGAVQPKINQGNMNNLSVIIPDTSTLRSYQDIVRPFFENILEIEQETATLSSIRDALLPKLMNGEIYVSIGKENPDE
ncbi:MAG: restriction endonuclease subunit S [Bellilinea sp.]